MELIEKLLCNHISSGKLRKRVRSKSRTEETTLSQSYGNNISFKHKTLLRDRVYSCSKDWLFSQHVQIVKKIPKRHVCVNSFCKADNWTKMRESHIKKQSNAEAIIF